MLGIGSLVGPNLNGVAPGLNVILQIQPPFFGRVMSGSDPFTVLWQDGRLETMIDGGALDELLDATLENRERLFLQVVRPVGIDGKPLSSARFDSQVIAVYKRRDGTSPDRVLLRGINTGTYYELAAEAVGIVPGL
jgi:hypothetical protein